MKKQLKQTLSLLMSLVMIISMFTGLEISSFAEDDILSYLTYEINDGEVTITGCDTEISGDIVLPDTIEGYPVTVIGDYAFKMCKKIESILIPDGVTKIGKEAFSNCEKLSEFIIPESVNIIDEGAFYYCDMLSDIIIPDSVTSIGKSAFSMCFNLRNISLGKNITKIGKYAFEETAYYNLYSNWNDNGLYIDNYFIIYEGESPYYTIEKGTITIADNAFSHNDYIEEITIPSGVISIGDAAFYSCNHLSSINIPDSVKIIGEKTFCDCFCLINITIPKNVESIGQYAFGYMFDYGIADYVKMVDIDARPINGTPGTVAETYADTNGIPFVSVGGDAPTTEVPTTEPTTKEPETEVPTTEVIPDEPIILGDIDGDGYTTSTDARLIQRVAVGLEVIKNRALADMDNDEKITSADARLALRYSALLDEPAENIAPARTYLDEERYYDTVINASFTDYVGGENVSIVISPGFASSTTNGNLFFKYDPTVLEFVSITAPDDILADITAGDKYEDGKISFSFFNTSTIEASNFDMCEITFKALKAEETQLEYVIGTWNGTPAPHDGSITLSPTPAPETPDVPEDDILSDITYEIINGEVIITSCYKPGNVVIPATIEGYPVTAIGDMAFAENNEITSVTIPNGVTEIGNAAFYYCSNLESISIPDSITSIGESAFYLCLKLESIDLPDNITEIAPYIFNTCTSLKSINIPENVTIIGDYAFSKCGSLTEVTIPDNVTTIGNYAFDSCEQLKSVTIPESVTSIGEMAFGFNLDWEIIEDFIIYSTSGTAAETYANENGITFIAVGDDEPTTAEPTTKEPETEPTTKDPVTQAPTTEKPTEKPTEAPTQKPVSDKLEVKDDTVRVDNTSKVSTVKTKSSANDILKSVKNEKVSIVDKDGKAVSGDALVGTGAKIQIKDNSGKVISTYTVCVPTDVDGNGKTTAADARLALRGSAKLDKVEGVYATASDMNTDGKITAADARMILRISAGLEKA